MPSFGVSTFRFRRLHRLVLLLLQPYRQLSIHWRSSQNLSLRFYRPFVVLDGIGKVAYRLQFLPGSRVHPVFHVSLLKPFNSNHQYTLHPLPPPIVELPSVHHPIALLDHHTIRGNGKTVSQVLLQWSDLNPKNSTWEDKILLESIPTFNANDSSLLTAVPDKGLSSSLSVGNLSTIHSKDTPSSHPRFISSSTSMPLAKPNIKDDVM